uniref:Putative secreted peptide n=1 Tax=Anopheles braziliensis TaxID=58242 RepID=A0A2M3ZS37_9DIPT
MQGTYHRSLLSITLLVGVVLFLEAMIKQFVYLIRSKVTAVTFITQNECNTLPALLGAWIIATYSLDRMK